MVIAQSFRRKGIGTQMLTKALEWFKSRGLEHVELSVAVVNKSGYKFWKNKGFTDSMYKMYKKL